MMNNEEFERKMAFIVEQQGQFATDIQQMRGVHEQLQATQAQTENVVILTTGGEAVTKNFVKKNKNLVRNLLAALGCFACKSSVTIRSR
jgi:hypothetical protein